MHQIQFLTIAIEVHKVFLYFLVGVVNNNIYCNIFSLINRENASCGIFAFRAWPLYPGRRGIIFSLRAQPTRGGILLHLKFLAS